MTISSVKKKPNGETATRLGRTRPTEKIIFGDKSGILLSEYLPSGTTINGLYSASIIERFRCAIVEEGGGNAPVDKCRLLLERLPSPN